MTRWSDPDPVASGSFWALEAQAWPRGTWLLCRVLGLRPGSSRGPKASCSVSALGGGWAAMQPAGALWTVGPSPPVQSPLREPLVSLPGALGSRWPGPRLPLPPLFPPQRERWLRSPTPPTRVSPAGGGGKAKVSGRPSSRKAKSPAPGLASGDRPPSVSSVHSEGDCNRRTPLTSRVWEDRPSSAGGWRGAAQAGCRATCHMLGGCPVTSLWGARSQACAREAAARRPGRPSPGPQMVRTLRTRAREKERA